MSEHDDRQGDPAGHIPVEMATYEKTCDLEAVLHEQAEFLVQWRKVHEEMHQQSLLADKRRQVKLSELSASIRETRAISVFSAVIGSAALAFGLHQAYSPYGSVSTMRRVEARLNAVGRGGKVSREDLSGQVAGVEKLVRNLNAKVNDFTKLTQISIHQKEKEPSQETAH